MTTLSIPDMNCGHCKAAVQAALTTVPDSGPAEVDLTNRTVTVAGPAALPDLLAALERAGYRAQVAG